MLQKGSRVEAKLIEEVDAKHWIVSFQGQLLQVLNTTKIEFESGLMLQLVVVNTNPLELQVRSRQDARTLRLNIHA